jgi:DNA-binding GntR family transcriptional regulator
MCGITAQRVTERADASDLKELTEYHKQMQKAEKEGNASEMASLNWTFHRRINLMADSPKILAALRTFTLSVPRAYLREWPHWMATANAQHGEILDAMRSGEADAAGRLMKAHILSAGADLINYLAAATPKDRKEESTDTGVASLASG